MTNPASSSATPLGWQVWAAVAVGAFLGTQARYLLGLAVPEESGAFPWTTFAINIIGSLLLGVLTGYAGVRDTLPRWVQAGLGPGTLGSFTTFSAVTLVGVTEPALMIPYLGLSLLVGLAMAAAGLAIGRRSAA